MAKIKFGMMMTDARGKLGGQVFSKNRSGAYVRTKVTPVNPRTDLQQSNRSLLGSLSSAWSNLTETQRSAWNSAVDNWQKTNVFGDLQKPPGKNLFTSLNKNRAYWFNHALMTLPPSKAEFIPLGNVSITMVAGGIALSVEGEALVGKTLGIRSTGKLSAGTTFVKNKLRNLGTVVIAAEGNQVLPIFSAVHGAVVPDSKYAWEVFLLDENGQLGVPVLIFVQSGS